ncbi:MAG: ABC transporter substrate-binding protein, partial [Treponema sp.]|nr:ABC transporter substrate-binding protein [Treponema sp.]
ILFSVAAFFALFLFSCKKNETSFSRLEIPGLNYERTLPLDYATAFQIDEYSTVTGKKTGLLLITVYGNDRYLLVPQTMSGEKLFSPENLPQGLRIISTPVKEVYLAATGAMALWNVLGAVPAIRFSSLQKKGWYMEETVKAMEEGRIIYAGKYNAPDFELLLKENCRLAIESTMIYHSPQIKDKLEQLGIPVFVDKASYEQSPLGRLEWIKLYGAMAGKENEASAFFDAQIAKIHSIVGEEKHSSRKKIAFFYINASGKPVVRGQDDYIVKMIELAGGSYAFSSSKKSKSPSLTVSMEDFYLQCADADILIYNSSIDDVLEKKTDLLEKSQIFSDFKAFQSGAIYTTGKNLYQATDLIGDVIIDFNKVLSGSDSDLTFLKKVKD